MQNFKIFNISSNPFNVEILSSALWQLNILGITEHDRHIQITCDDTSDVTLSEINGTLKHLVREELINSFSADEETIENKNWNEEWEKKTKVIEVSDKIVIKPTFREYEANKNQIVITIDPKMSFGTGEHQTTKIMLQLLDKHIQLDDNVLDVGSGTSVLGIAASKLGAKSVIAIDNDEWCHINGIENVKKNNTNNVEVICGTVDEIIQKEYNLILANINKNVLLDIKNRIFNLTKKNGKVILSGLLVNDKEEIKKQFTQLGLTALETQQIDEWIGIVFLKA